jgi:hypothetical protein
MQKSHLLMRLQSLIAILLVILFCLLAISDESSQLLWLVVGIVPFMGISLVTMYLGWLMVAQKEMIVSPSEHFLVRIVERVRGQQAAENLIAAYRKPNRQKVIGLGNIISGLFCLLLAIAGIIQLLRDL